MMGGGTGVYQVRLDICVFYILLLLSVLLPLYSSIPGHHTAPELPCSRCIRPSLDITLVSIATPCSVKAIGLYFECSPLFKMPIWLLKEEYNGEHCRTALGWSRKDGEWSENA
jgi:hypothetical protein